MTQLNKEDLLNFLHEEAIDVASDCKVNQNRYNKFKRSKKDAFYEGCGLELRIISAAIKSGRFDE